MDVAEHAFALLKPSNALYFALIGAIVLAAVRRRAGLAALVAVAAAWGAVAYLPLGRALLRPLEAQFATPRDPGPLAGIIVLGGYHRGGVVSEPPYNVAVSDAGERITAGIALALSHPQARVILSDASGTEQSGALMEAVGVEPARLVLETQARSTLDNAVLTRAMVDPQPGERFALVTSAWHMPRAVGTFRTAGWSGLVPIPVDYTGGGGSTWETVPLAPTDGLTEFDRAAREWLALLEYRALGRTARLFPGPAG